MKVPILSWQDKLVLFDTPRCKIQRNEHGEYDGNNVWYFAARPATITTYAIKKTINDSGGIVLHNRWHVYELLPLHCAATFSSYSYLWHSRSNPHGN